MGRARKSGRSWQRETAFTDAKRRQEDVCAAKRRTYLYSMLLTWCASRSDQNLLPCHGVQWCMHG